MGRSTDSGYAGVVGHNGRYNGDDLSVITEASRETSRDGGPSMSSTSLLSTNYAPPHLPQVPENGPVDGGDGNKV